MINVQFIVNTGQFQHVAVTVEGTGNPSGDGTFVDELAYISDNLKAALGAFQAELESWVKDTYRKAINGQIDDAIDLLKRELGATVVSEEVPEPAPAITDQPAWSRPMEAKKKEWDDDWD